ncbi:MAG: hypothetical protein RLZZ522_2103 [Verrucomicrobiota bacterium]|jgi:rhodanese-related sulfurtransferase
MTGRSCRWLALVPGFVALSCVEPPVAAPPPPPIKPPVSKPLPPAVAPGVVSRMPLADFFQLHQAGNPLTYDVRPGIYYRFGHIPGAQSWPKRGYEAQLAVREAQIRSAVAAKRPVVLYCTDPACPDSNTIAQHLAARGHSVAILEGGYEVWKAAELPSE